VSLLFAAIGFGLVTAAVLAIAAVGFTMQFAVTDVLNLAYSGVMIVAAYVGYAVNSDGISVWIGMLAAIAAGAILSVLLNRFIFTPFQRRDTSGITLVIVTLGVTLILVFGLQAIVGGSNVSYSMDQGASLDLGGLQLSVVQLVIIALAVIVMASIHGLLKYTRLGKAPLRRIDRSPATRGSEPSAWSRRRGRSRVPSAEWRAQCSRWTPAASAPPAQGSSSSSFSLLCS
jgi:branched-subunit amino acid ABC-type transport system permease component